MMGILRRLELWQGVRGLGQVLRIARANRLRLQVSRNGAITIIDPAHGAQPARALRLARRHLPYIRDMVTFFEYHHGAVEPVMVDGIALADYSSPRLHTVRPSGDVFRFTGLAEPDETTEVYLAHAGLLPGQLVLDLGAYCGASTVSFARAVGPAGHVVAFEPDPENAAALRENLTRHLITNVSVIEAGVWRETGRFAFVAEGNMGSALAAVLPRRGRTSERSFLSLADAVQQACDRSGLHRVAFMKMDIEGAEVAVLETAREVLQLHKSRLAIEPHRAPTSESPERLTTEQVAELLGRSGYRCQLAHHGVMRHLLILAAPQDETITY